METGQKVLSFLNIALPEYNNNFSKAIIGNVTPIKSVKAISLVLSDLNQEKIAKHSPKKPKWIYVFNCFKQAMPETECLKSESNIYELSGKAIHNEYTWLKNHFRIR